MSKVSAREYLRSLKDIDPEVLHRADSLVCQLSMIGDPTTVAWPDKSITIQWKWDGVTVTSRISKDR